MSARTPDITEISVLVRRAVNVHGELHLNRLLTETLLNWLKANERNWQAQAAQLAELQELLKPLLELS